MGKSKPKPQKMAGNVLLIHVLNQLHGHFKSGLATGSSTQRLSVLKRTMTLCHGLRVLPNKERESKVPPLVPSRQKNVQLFTDIKLLAAL